MIRPIRFDPCLKRTIWGSETWTLSAVAGHESVSSFGTLPELIGKYRGALVGDRVWKRFGTNFPILVKFIDTHADLSVQVHPDDEFAAKHHHDSGKTEMWYIFRTEPGAKIYAGLKSAVDPSRIETDLVGALAVYEPRPGDVFYVPAGCVHAIGGGNCLVEIQQTSDATYRIHDYGRKDANGHPRELHLDLAREAIDYTVGTDCRVSYDRTQDVVEVVSSPYFCVSRALVTGERTIDLGTDAFVLAICVEGEVMVNGVAAEKGDTLLVPACDNRLRVSGSATLLTVTMNGLIDYSADFRYNSHK